MKKFLATLLLGLTLSGCSEPDVVLPDFSTLVERTAPAVVNISTTLKGMPESEGALENPFPEGLSLIHI